MPTKHFTPLPAPAAPAVPAVPARVSPVHLPALAHAAADLDGTDYPIKIINPAELGPCEDCQADTLGDVLDAIATVVAYAGIHTHCEVVCALHLPVALKHYRRADRPVTVEVPAESELYFVRSDRETYWALDEAHGIGVARTHLGGWAAWDVVDGVTRSVPLAVFPADFGDPASRLDAECWAQDHAARRAAEAYELASAVTVALPVVVDVTGAAA